jgi:hypothetical protein
LAFNKVATTVTVGDFPLLHHEKSIRNNRRRCEIHCRGDARSAILHSRTAAKGSSIKCQTGARGVPRTSQQPVFCSRQQNGCADDVHISDCLRVPSGFSSAGIQHADCDSQRDSCVRDFYSDDRRMLAARMTRREKSGFPVCRRARRILQDSIQNRNCSINAKMIVQGPYVCHDRAKNSISLELRSESRLFRYERSTGKFILPMIEHRLNTDCEYCIDNCVNITGDTLNSLILIFPSTLAHDTRACVCVNLR